MPKPTGNIRVAVVGAAGRMGREVLKAVSEAADLDLVLAVDRAGAGTPVRELAGPGAPDIVVEDRLGAGLERTEAHVLVDFTTAAAAAVNAEMAVKRGVAPVIGATGIDRASLRTLATQCQEGGVPAMYVPNFAIGAVLLMKFAEMAAKWLPDVEIIELHHEKKEDAPSGTAMRTAEMISAVRKAPAGHRGLTTFKVEGVRGGKYQDIQIHSVRLRGLLAHQEVLFGGQGEVLTLRHDSMDRSSFMEGVKLCVRKVWDRQGLTTGMDSLLVE